MAIDNNIDELARYKYLLILMRASIESKRLSELCKEYNLDAKTFRKLRNLVKTNPTKLESESYKAMRTLIRDISDVRERALKMSERCKKAKDKTKKVTLEECL